MHTFHARFLSRMDRGNVSIKQQIKKGHSNKCFIEIAVLARIGKYRSRSFPRMFLDLACCSVHEPTEKVLDQYIFHQCGPYTCSVWTGVAHWKSPFRTLIGLPLVYPSSKESFLISSVNSVYETSDSFFTLLPPYVRNKSQYNVCTSLTVLTHLQGDLSV